MRKYIFAHPWLFAVTLITIAASQALYVLTAMISRNFIDALTVGDNDAFFRLIFAAVAVVFLQWLGTAVSPRIAFAYRAKTARTLKKDLFDSILGMKISDFNHGNSAKYISVLNNDVTFIENNYFATIPHVLADIANVGIAITAMFIMSPLNALIVIAMSSLPLAAPFIYGKKLSKTSVTKSTSAIYVNQKTKDYLTGFEVIKTFGVEKNIKQKFFSVISHYMKATYKAGAAAADVGALNTSLLQLASYVNYFVAGYFVLKGDITVGTVLAITGLSAGVQGPVLSSSNRIASLKSAKEVNKRVLEIMEQKDSRPRDIKINTLEKGIEFKNVSFSYKTEEPRKNPEKTMVLKNVCYNFKKGGKYAIVGQSGSGKSTLIKIIMGYYDNYEGDVCISGHNIRDIDRESLYNVVSTLHQNVFLLDDTLRNNVTLYNNYSNEEYRAALQKANLTGVEAALPNGSNTVLGEGGNTISGGERQRVSIARSILKGSEVMILDEATASLDNVIAHDIEKSIIDMKDLTCIFVTHRYSRDILEKCDGILVMKDGILFENGTFEDLYESKGYFYSLINILNLV